MRPGRMAVACNRLGALLGTMPRLRWAAWVGWFAVASLAHPLRSAAQFDLSEIGYDGFSEAVDDIMVAAYESGRLERLLVKVGDQVKAGQVLAILDQAPQQIAVESAESVATMRGALELAAADRSLHEVRLNQLKALAVKGNARREEVDRAEAEWQMASARYLNATEERAQRAIELKHAQEQLRRRQVISPIDGVVAKVYVDAGEFVLPSDLTVVRVINRASLKAIFNVPAAEAARMSVGQVVRVQFTSISRSAEGVIDTIAPMIEADSGTIPVTVRIDNSSQRWMAGDRCLMDPISRPRPNRVSANEARESASEAKVDQPMPVYQATEKTSVIIAVDAYTITDLPDYRSANRPNVRNKP